MIAIAICATKSYTYAMRAQARRVAANVVRAGVEPGHVILVGDNSDELKGVSDFYRNILPEGWKIVLAGNPSMKEGGENYKAKAQLLISEMRTEAFTFCRKLKADLVWSLDSDVLPPDNALVCMMQGIEFDGGYYAVSFCPYPNTAFLGGFGSPTRPIEEDFLPSERVIPDDLKKEIADNEAEQKKLGEDKKQPTDEQRKRWDATAKKIRECPPDGNIFQVNGKYGWRRRGWLDHAYPAIGRGSMVPSEWCGFGCTLMNKTALSCAHFEGYDGQGTEDLFICWKRWYPAGLRINVLTHCPCDHVIWEKKKGGNEKTYTHHVAYHETEGEYRGHLRVRQMPWVPETAYI